MSGASSLLAMIAAVVVMALAAPRTAVLISSGGDGGSRGTATSGEPQVLGVVLALSEPIWSARAAPDRGCSCGDQACDQACG